VLLEEVLDGLLADCLRLGHFRGGIVLADQVIIISIVVIGVVPRMLRGTDIERLGW
jgi:hypothetical protein